MPSITSEDRQIENEKAFDVLQSLYDANLGARDSTENEDRSIGQSRGGAKIICIKCECSDESCALRIPLTLREYQKVHDDKSTFTVSPAHNVDLNEVISIQKSKYNAVKKDVMPNRPRKD